MCPSFLHRKGTLAENVNRVIETALAGDEVLLKAWQKFALWHHHANQYHKYFKSFQRWILISGLHTPRDARATPTEGSDRGTLAPTSVRVRPPVLPAAACAPLTHVSALQSCTRPEVFMRSHTRGRSCPD